MQVKGFWLKSKVEATVFFLSEITTYALIPVKLVLDEDHHSTENSLVLRDEQWVSSTREIR